MEFVFANNAGPLHLASDISTSTTSFSLAPGEGDLLPSLSSGQVALLTAIDTAGNLEIMHVTSLSGDAITVTRGEEGTSARSFAASSTVLEHRLTAGTLGQFAQLDRTNTFTQALNEAEHLQLPAGATVSLGEANGNVGVISGTGNISGLGSAPDGAHRVVVFDGDMTLIHGAGINIPGSADLSVSTGDRCTFRRMSGAWELVHYTAFASPPETRDGAQDRVDTHAAVDGPHTHNVHRFAVMHSTTGIEAMVDGGIVDCGELTDDDIEPRLDGEDWNPDHYYADLSRCGGYIDGGDMEA